MRNVFLVGLMALVLPFAAPAQNQVTCESQKGRRVECDMNTRGEVRMLQRLSKSPCTEGESWGLSKHSVWVSNGCRAVFKNFSAEEDYGSSGRDESRGRMSASERAGMGRFDANGQVSCSQFRGQPMGQCRFGVARDPGGVATVIVTMPDGRKRAIFFEHGKPLAADTSQADGYGEFRWTMEDDLYMIRVGDERYEFPEVVVFGG